MPSLEPAESVLQSKEDVMRRPCIAFILSAAMVAGCQNMKVSQRTPRVPNFPVGASNSKEMNGNQLAEIQFGLGRSLEAQGNLEKAKSAYYLALESNPRLAAAYRRLAIVYDQQAQYDKVDEMFRKALEMKPGSADIFCDLGYSMYQRRRWAEAEMNFRQAIAIEPAHTRAHNNLGLLLAQTDRAEESLAEFRAAGNSIAEAHLNLAFVQAVNGKLQDAVHTTQTALAAAPESPSVRERLQELSSIATKLNQPTQLAEAAPAPPQTITVGIEPPTPAIDPFKPEPPSPDLLASNTSESKAADNQLGPFQFRTAQFDDAELEADESDFGVLGTNADETSKATAVSYRPEAAGNKSAEWQLPVVVDEEPTADAALAPLEVPAPPALDETEQELPATSPRPAPTIRRHRHYPPQRPSTLSERFFRWMEQ